MKIFKTDLINQLHDLTDENGRHKYTKRDADEFIDDLCNIIAQNIQNGDAVSIYGFGCFDIIERAARPCLTPQGERIMVDAHWSPKFYPGEKLRRAVKVMSDNEKRGI